MSPESRKLSSTGIVKEWSAYIAIGTFILYLFGYLALRFHLTALGIVTDLGVLDDRYLFAGAKFFVFFANCIPFLALIILALWGVKGIVHRLAPSFWRFIWDLFDRPLVLLGSAVTIAVLSIRFIMTPCFAIRDLPFRCKLPGPGWVQNLLRSQDDIDITWFFIGLLLTAAAVSGLVFRASRRLLLSHGAHFLFGIATALALITILLIPVNFGILVMPYSIERTKSLGKLSLAAGQKAWLLSEDKDWVTYFSKSGAAASVVVIPVKEIDKIEVVGSDSLFDILADRSSNCR